MRQALATLIAIGLFTRASAEEPRRVADYPPDDWRSSWDDVTEGVHSLEQWNHRRADIKKEYLALIRDEHKPARPPLDLQVLESRVVGAAYERRLISYQVEEGERARAYLGIPLKFSRKAPGVVALHGTFERGIEQAAGLVDNPEKAYLDHLCRRGYVVIAPEHFVSGERVPPEGAYDTARFHEKHPEWTAVGKFTYEHSIALDILAGMPDVDADRLGVMGHSLGGQGAIFLAAYDERLKAAVSNCAASFFRHNPGVEHWARDHWYVYFKHIRPGLIKGELPPIDFHEIVSLIAPRAFIDVSALNDGDRRVQRQRVLMLTSLMDVWRLHKAERNFAFFVHGHGHSVPHDSRELIYGWLDARLKDLPPLATLPRE